MSREPIVPEFRPPGDIVRGGGEAERERNFASHHAEYKSQLDPRHWVTRNTVGGLDLRLLAFIVIAMAVVIITAYILSDVTEQHILYVRDVGGPSAEIIIIGTSISILAASMATYYTYSNMQHRMWIFWMYISYIILFLLWVFNLAIRIDLHDEGMRHEGNGFIFIFSSTLFLLGLIYVTNGNYLLFLSLLWNMYLLYTWLFVG